MRLPRFPLAATLVALAPVVLAAENAPSSKPNILLILTDDQGYADLGCQGSPDLRTPNIDSIAASGVRFSHGYVTAPQCSPSRAGMLTGIAQNRFGYLDNNNNRGLPALEDAPTIAEILRSTGYRTKMIGKWHIGAERNEEGGASTGGALGLANLPEKRGFDEVVMIEEGGSHYFPYSPSGIKYMKDRGREPRLREVSGPDKLGSFIENLPPETYLTDYFSERAAEFVRLNKSKPWFLYLAYNAPHDPVMAPDADIEANSHIKDEKRKKYAGMVTAVDRGVGEVLAALKETDQLENTIVIFLSDNGAPPENGGRNAPLQGWKGDLFEGGVRVPYMVSWPAALPAGKVYDNVVSSLDILPTAAMAAGASLHNKLDGVDLVPFLTGSNSGQPHPIHRVAWRQAYFGIENNLKMIRNNKQPKADRYSDIKKLPADTNFNLEENPGEDPENQVTEGEDLESLVNSTEKWRAVIDAEAQSQSLNPSPAGLR